MTLPQFTPGMAEVNVFDVAGYRAVADRASGSVRNVGAEAVARAKSRLAKAYGARNPERGWIGFVMFTGVLAAALAAAFSSGFRSDASDVATVAVALSLVAAVCETAALVGSRLRPMNRFVLRMQAFICIALAIAVAFSFSQGLASTAIVHLACLLAAVLVAVAVVVVRARDADATGEIDLSIERAYLRAISEVDEAAAQAQAELNAELDPETVEVIRRVRSALFAEIGPRHAELAAFDPSTPVGTALIAAHTAPDRWLPPSVARARHRALPGR